MNVDQLDTKLAQVEARLSRIESKLALPKIAATPPAKPAKMPQTAEAALISTASQPDQNASITNLLGWSGATALVLAAVYLVRLAIDAGWLTPERQVGIAVLAGLVLIGIGLALRHINRQYASLLPAGGIGTPRNQMGAGAPITTAWSVGTFEAR